MKEDYQLLKIKNQLTRDSLDIYIQMNTKKDEIILNKDKQIELEKENQNNFKGIIVEKDNQISEWKKKYKRERTLKIFSFGVTGLTMIGAVLLIL